MTNSLSCIVPSIPVEKQIIKPLDTLTFEEKMTKVISKLKMMDHLYNSNDSAVSAAGIHVFVDCSNIVIGVYKSRACHASFIYEYRLTHVQDSMNL